MTARVLSPMKAAARLVIALAIFAAMGVTSASATSISFDITNANGGLSDLPTSTVLGSVTVTLNTNGTLTVGVKLIPGLSTFIVPDGNDINFNGLGTSWGSAGTTASDFEKCSSWPCTSSNETGLTFTQVSGQNVGSGLGAYSLTMKHIAGAGQPLYYVTFTLSKTGGFTNADLQNLLTLNSPFAFHLGHCVNDPNTNDCSSVAGNTSTGFVGTKVSRVPEPGSMALLGTGLLGLGAAVRRKFLTV